MKQYRTAPTFRWGAALAAALLQLVLAFNSAWAHKPSDSYLNLRAQASELRGQWDIALRDLEVAVGIDDNRDAKITWGEVKERREAIGAYVFQHLNLRTSSGPCDVRVDDLLLDNHSDGTYAVILFHSACNIRGQYLEIGYDVLFSIDPSHRGIVTVSTPSNSRSVIFNPDNRVQRFEPGTGTWLDSLRATGQFVSSGVWHIWTGFDHVLFLLTLLLPAALYRAGTRWMPVATLGDALKEVIKVVTSFTLAHSITLTLVVLGVVTLPSRFVETTIAFSVLLSSLNNIYPVVVTQRWGIALLFGLIHGCGFASVMTDAGLPQANLVGSLVGFNLGVELGQLAIVAAVLPLLYLARTSNSYRRAGLNVGSALSSVIAGVWMVERAFGLVIFGL